MAKQKSKSGGQPSVRNKAKNEHTKKKSQKSKGLSSTWQFLIAIVVLALGVGVYYSIEQSSSEDLDLSVIEQGVNVVVQIHDPG